MTRITVLDTETSGMDPETSCVIELAACDVTQRPGEPWQRVSDRDALIQPTGPIAPEASAVHHLTADDLVDAEPDLVTAAHRVLPAREPPAAWAAHNAEFDRGFMSSAIAQIYPDTVVPWICTWRCALHVWPEAPGHSNQVLRYWLGLTPEELTLPDHLHPHRALYDTIVTAQLLIRLLNERPLEELIRLTTEPALLRRVNFGTHRGENWENVPRSYMRWILTQDFNADVVYTCRHYLHG